MLICARHRVCWGRAGLPSGLRHPAFNEISWHPMCVNVYLCQSRSTVPLLEDLYRMLYITAMDIVTFSEARANLKAVMDRACADRAPVVVKRARGQENVVIVPQGEWDGMQETMHLLASPRNAERLLASIAELDAGRGEEHELIEPGA